VPLLLCGSLSDIFVANNESIMAAENHDKNRTFQAAILVEICVDSVSSCRIAESSGANRLELCCSLIEGGLTASYGLISNARKAVKIPIHVLIRPRAGDFNYSETELLTCLSDIAMCKQLTIEGIVIGVLNPDSSIDLSAMQRIIDAAKPMNITFHRAFDMIKEPFAALDQLILLNQQNYSNNDNKPVIQRVLTSGQAISAIEGRENVCKYRDYLSEKKSSLILMPGAGINEENVIDLLKSTQCNEVHASTRCVVKSLMQFHQKSVYMGGEKHNTVDSEYEIKQADPEKLKKFIEKANSLEQQLT
jgi:copper homeostasis protein